MTIATAPLTQIEIIFEIGIALSHLIEVLNRRGRQWRSSQMGMDYHSGCIDDSTESGLNLKIDLPLKKGIEVFKREKGIP
jgi:hypothetical protein